MIITSFNGEGKPAHLIKPHKFLDGVGSLPTRRPTWWIRAKSSQKIKFQNTPQLSSETVLLLSIYVNHKQDTSSVNLKYMLYTFGLNV